MLVLDSSYKVSSMNHFNALQVGRLDSVDGVGQSNVAKAPSLARFLSQRANEVLGTRQTTQSTRIESVAVEAAAAPLVPQESAAPANLQLARQMEQMQRLHNSLSLSSNPQGINVVV